MKTHISTPKGHKVKETRFDYNKQAWIENGAYVRCAHPESMDCKCYGKLHEGERAAK